jgi:hypothetical protein
MIRRQPGLAAQPPMLAVVGGCVWFEVSIALIWDSADIRSIAFQEMFSMPVTRRA